MKHIVRLLLLLACSISSTVFAYEQQGTTIKKDSCNLVVTIQLGIETDTATDIAMIQNALNDCFSITCDLPCEDRTVAKCNIKWKIVVLNWKDIRGSDRTKFHHITMLPGAGTSYVDKLGTPNGNSVSGKWHRH
ncbi:MAG TPA: hypothetical protein PL009_13965, partial [Flavipsychrobacter sp.]|nr:hypothetical protein [Flavipsychrobacter sp.]